LRQASTPNTNVRVDTPTPSSHIGYVTHYNPNSFVEICRPARFYHSAERMAQMEADHLPLHERGLKTQLSAPHDFNRKSFNSNVTVNSKIFFLLPFS
jgi:hypothetical protein